MPDQKAFFTRGFEARQAGRSADSIPAGLTSQQREWWFAGFREFPRYLEMRAEKERRQEQGRKLKG